MAIDNEALENVNFSPRYTGDTQTDKFQQDLALEFNKLKGAINPLSPATAPNPIGNLGPITPSGQIVSVSIPLGNSTYSIPSPYKNAIPLVNTNAGVNLTFNRINDGTRTIDCKVYNGEIFFSHSGPAITLTYFWVF